MYKRKGNGHKIRKNKDRPAREHDETGLIKDMGERRLFLDPDAGIHSKDATIA